MTAKPHHEGGFLLVGVVIFVLALTILGMSLFSLSSYESGFQLDAHDSNAAFHDAQSGLAMVQAILTLPPYSLSSSQTAIGHRGIAYATATQRRDSGPSLGTVDSAGAIDWNDTVTVTVRARVRDGEHTLVAKYLPSPRENYYKRLFTISGTSVSKSPGTEFTSIYVESSNPPFDFLPNLRMKTLSIGDTCHVWQTSSDSSWIARTTWNKQRPLKLGGVPPPDVPGYYASHPPSWTPTVVGGNKLVFDKHAAGTVGYYSTPDNSSPNYSYYPVVNIELEVHGTVVWEMPRGFRADGEITIKGGGSSTSTLVIVGSPFPGRTGANNDPLLGIWFFAGFNIQGNTNVILVSDGQVNIERSYNPIHLERAPRLSVYANALYLMGPLLFSETILDHVSDMDAAIDDLQSLDALPHPVGATPGIFTLLRGSWRDLTP